MENITFFVDRLLNDLHKAVERKKQVQNDLFEAVKKANVAGVERALAAGVNVNEKGGFFGKSALRTAIIYGNLEAKYGNLEVARLLIENGANIDDQGINGTSVLMFAVNVNYLEAAKLLIENGANVNVQDVLGYSGLMLIARRGYLEAAKLLIENDANIIMENQKGETALKIAEQRGKIAVAKLIRAKRQKAVQEGRKELYPDLSKLISEFEN